MTAGEAGEGELAWPLTAPSTYVKASNHTTLFGSALALSADGSTLAVGSYQESSAATGINGNQASTAAAMSGAVYVYVRAGATWTQQAYVKASNTGRLDEFGWSVALSSDGSTLVVGAPGEQSAAAGVNGNQASNTADRAGAAYVFTRSGTTWRQQAYVKASNPNANDVFGTSVAVAGDGATIAVGAPGEASAALGINGNQADNAASAAGAAYVFARSGTAWAQQAYVKASNTAAGDHLGDAVALSGDGGWLAVGASQEDGGAPGINGNQADNAAASAGAAYLYARAGATWAQQAYVKASNPGASAFFGNRLALASDGATLAIAAVGESGSSSGINGDQTSQLFALAGAAYVLVRSGTTWTQQAYVKASNPQRFDEFASSLALSADGNSLAIGAFAESSAATGLDGNQLDESAVQAGAGYLYHRASGAWSQQAYVKASNTDARDAFGTAIGLSGDGAVLAIGAENEASAATGINGNQADNSRGTSGAVYVYQ